MNPIKFSDSKSSMPYLVKVSDRPFFADGFTTSSLVEQSHGDGLNVIYGDGHLRWHSGLNFTALTGYGTGYSTPYQKIWTYLTDNP